MDEEFNDSIEDIGSQNVPIPEIPKPKDLPEVIPGPQTEFNQELHQDSGPSIEDRTEQKKRDAVLNLINDVSAQREDIDKVMNAIPQVIEQINKISQVVDKQSEAINELIKGGRPAAAPGATGGGMDLEKIETIGTILEKLGDVYTKIKGNPQPVSDEFTKTLLENSKAEALQNQNITSLINKKVKNRLINDVVSEVAGDFLGGTQGTGIEHGPA